MLACSGDDDATPATTVPEPTWVERAADAFEPLASSAFELPDKVRRWLAGEVTDADHRATLDVALDDATETRDRVRALPDAPAKDLYLASAELHVQHVRIHLETIAMEPGPQRDQVVLLARRVRQLGDRVFDRGLALVDPTFGADEPDVQINLPEEVPDWEAEGMAVGPPLDAEPGPPADAPQLRAETRPVQPQDDWLAAVASSGAPATLDLDGDLAAQARAYVDAAEVLRYEPDPDVEGGRERSAVLRLGWLVKADAVRAAQAGLDEIAEELDQIAL